MPDILAGQVALCRTEPEIWEAVAPTTFRTAGDYGCHAPQLVNNVHENLRRLIDSAADEGHRGRPRQALQVVRAPSPPQPIR